MPAMLVESTETLCIFSPTRAALCSTITRRCRQRIPRRELPLVPIRIRGRHVAGGIQTGDLFASEIPSDGTDVLAALFFVACADDDVGYGRALQEPVQGNLGNGFAGFAGYFVESVDDFVEIFIRNRWAGVGRGSFVQAADGGLGLITAD